MFAKLVEALWKQEGAKSLVAMRKLEAEIRVIFRARRRSSVRFGTTGWTPPRVIDEAMNGKMFNLCVETQPVPTLRPSCVVIVHHQYPLGQSMAWLR